MDIIYLQKMKRLLLTVQVLFYLLIINCNLLIIQSFKKIQGSLEQSNKGLMVMNKIKLKDIHAFDVEVHSK